MAISAVSLYTLAMALEAISGVNKLPFMNKFDEVQKNWDLQQIETATSNFTNPYSLMAPPFENVSSEALYLRHINY